MSNKRLVLLGSIAVILILLVIYLAKTFSRDDWRENFHGDDKNPYGGIAIKEALNEVWADGQLEEIEKKGVKYHLSDDRTGDGGETYFFLGGGLFMDSLDTRTLLDFVANGNVAFISSNSIPQDLMFEVYFEECKFNTWEDYSKVQDTVRYLNLNHPDLRFDEYKPLYYYTRRGVSSNNWSYIDSSYFCNLEKGLIPLGTYRNGPNDGFLQKDPYHYPDSHEVYQEDDAIEEDTLNGSDTSLMDSLVEDQMDMDEGFLYNNQPDTSLVLKQGSAPDLINFARCAYGDGYFYLHTTPVVFSNISLKEESNVEYVSRVLSHIPKGKIYWDSYSQVPEWFSRSRNTPQQSRQLSREGPLQYILTQPPLAFAWWGLLLMGLLFLVFRTRRRQRVIPLLPANNNTSLEHLGVIAQSYFLRKDHRKMALLQMEMLENFLRDRYNILGQKSNPDFTSQVADVAQVEVKEIEKMVSLHVAFNHAKKITADELIDFYRRINLLYDKLQ